MRILALHNRYQQRGGEDAVFDFELAQLRSAGHEVSVCVWDNDVIASPVAALAHSVGAIWSRSSHSSVREELLRFRPDVVHIHNWFPQVSASAMTAVVEAGVPCIQTLHNFRSICAGALLYRDGKVCTDCVGGSKLPGLLHRCYRDSLAASAVVTGAAHQVRRFWSENRRLVRLIALSDFAKALLIRDGIDPELIVVKGNSAPDLGAGPVERDGGILFVGRLSAEKGAALLPDIAARVTRKLTVIGDGPLMPDIRSRATPNLTLLGKRAPNEVAAVMRAASVVVLPSVCFEGFPMVLAEAFAAGTPVVAPDLAAFPELIAASGAGVLAPPGDSAGWAAAVDRLLANEAERRAMGRRARAYYEAELSPAANVQRLTAIYRDALSRASFQHAVA